jgi:hypothetical protein
MQIQVVLGQGSADPLITVVVFVHNRGGLPSPNRVPFQSALFPADGGEVDPPLGVCLIGGVSRNLRLLNGYRQSSNFNHYVKRHQEIR